MLDAPKVVLSRLGIDHPANTDDSLFSKVMEIKTLLRYKFRSNPPIELHPGTPLGLYIDKYVDEDGIVHECRLIGEYAVPNSRAFPSPPP